MSAKVKVTIADATEGQPSCFFTDTTEGQPSFFLTDINQRVSACAAAQRSFVPWRSSFQLEQLHR